MERKKSSSKSSKKEHSSKKKVEEISRTTKRAYKRIHYQESSSEDSENAGPSRSQESHGSSLSGVTGEDNSFKEAPKKLEKERNRPPYKSSKKHHSLTKRDEETMRLTRSDLEKVTNENTYSEDSSLSDIDIDLTGIDNYLFDAKYNDQSNADKLIEKAPRSPATPLSNSDFTDSRSSSPFQFWGRDALKPIVPMQHSKSDEHIKDSADVNDVTGARNVLKVESKATWKKDWEKFKAQHTQRKLTNENKQGGSKIVKDGTEVKDGVCGRNAPKVPNKNNLGKEGENLKSKEILKKQPENWKELNRPKIDDAKNADKKKPDDDVSNENVADLKFSPLTAENKGVLKRQSDPSNALKENRPRTSL